MSRLKLINGTWHSPYMDEAIIQGAMDYKPQRSDVFICTYPKSGTSWIHTIVNYIVYKGDPLQFPGGVRDFFFDFVGKDVIERLPPPRVIPTHFKETEITYSPKAKYIHLVRNPKDVCASYYTQLKSSPHFGMVTESLDQFVNDFLAGYVPFGSYFEHFVSWYEYTDAPNLLLLTYEDLKRDLKGNIIKIAEFLGREYSDVLQEELVLENIVEKCSLASLKKELPSSTVKIEDKNKKSRWSFWSKKGSYLLSQMCSMNTPAGDKNKVLDSTCSVKKGEIGAWREVLNEEMSRKIEEKFLEATKDLDVSEVLIDTDWIAAETTNV